MPGPARLWRAYLRNAELDGRLAGHPGPGMTS
jgi:hypothetical protein